MNAHEFAKQLDDARIVEAIKAAERKTSGEIRVYVSYRKRKIDIMKRAAARFEKLGMTATRDRNAVLLYFAPRDREFAVIGDQGIHEKCGPDFWSELTRDLSKEFRQGHFAEAVAGVIQKTGEILARHFPRHPDDRNELPDHILTD